MSAGVHCPWMPRKKAQDRTDSLKGWKVIAEYLEIPPATAQLWARNGMPVGRGGRFTVANPKELGEWLGRESNMPGPAQVMTNTVDVAGALKAYPELFGD